MVVVAGSTHPGTQEPCGAKGRLKRFLKATSACHQLFDTAGMRVKCHPCRLRQLILDTWLQIRAFSKRPQKVERLGFSANWHMRTNRRANRGYIDPTSRLISRTFLFIRAFLKRPQKVKRLGFSALNWHTRTNRKANRGYIDPTSRLISRNFLFIRFFSKRPQKIKRLGFSANWHMCMNRRANRGYVDPTSRLISKTSCSGRQCTGAAARVWWSKESTFLCKANSGSCSSAQAAQVCVSWLWQ